MKKINSFFGTLLFALSITLYGISIGLFIGGDKIDAIYILLLGVLVFGWSAVIDITERIINKEK
jgi:hypothetical protein